MIRNYRQLLLETFGEVLHNPGSIIGPEEEAAFWGLLDKTNFSAKTLVEIGTARGISTLLLAEVADRIVTFDVVEYEIKHKIWKHFGVAENINSRIVSPNFDSIDIQEALRDIEYDAAFIDGNHGYLNVKKDIETVESCRQILFHDQELSGVRQAIEELEARRGGTVHISKRFAVWQA